MIKIDITKKGKSRKITELGRGDIKTKTEKRIPVQLKNIDLFQKRNNIEIEEKSGLRLKWKKKNFQENMENTCCGR